MIRLILFASLLVLTTLSPGALAAPDYPKTIEAEGMSLRVHHPVIDRWADYALLEGWIPVEVTDPEGVTWVGAVRAQARTSVNLEARLVALRDKSVVATRFSDPKTPEAVKALAASTVLGSQQEVLLDEILLSLADDFEPPVAVNSGVGFNRRPPRIVVSETPLGLLLIDQEPVRAAIQGTSLEVVVNTDWDLFWHQQERLYYVINNGVWQTQSLLAMGGWNSTDRLPRDFEALAAGDRWQSVLEALPAQIPAVAPPEFLISLEPTELIVIDGAPKLQSVPGADGLEVVSNSERDLFRLAGNWYFLAAGRWFQTRDLAGNWSLVDELPEAFASIPPDHGRAHVRRSVPGTLESALAYIEATLPQERVVSSGSGPGQNVYYVGEPSFQPITNTTLERAVNTPFAVIRHNNFYYLNHEAAWYSASSPTGPWRATVQVPDEIYTIPPNDPLYHVTFVRPIGNQDDGSEARFQYTEGYNGRYTIGRQAVRGTGWSYSPWIGHPPSGPVYWGYPHTYGWGRYGYWGSPWYWSSYPISQSFEIDGPVRGVGGTPANVSEQDPGVTRRGYDYATLAQQRGAGDTISPYLANDLFADPNGEVYRRTDDGWAKHNSSGEWDTMGELERQYGVSSPEPQAPEGQQRQAYRQNEEDIERMERYYERRSKSYNMYSTIYVRR
ncbi:MAG: hypothetical protein AAGH19_04860 [Pseudomonadota bacterium]